MKKNYYTLEIDVVALSMQDVVTFSSGNDANDVTGNDPYDFEE